MCSHSQDVTGMVQAILRRTSMLRNISTSQSSIACAGDAGLRFSGMLLYRAFHLRASIDKSSGDGRSFCTPGQSH